MAGRHRAVSKRGTALRGLPVAVALPAAIAFGIGPGAAQAAQVQTVSHTPDLPEYAAPRPEPVQAVAAVAPLEEHAVAQSVSPVGDELALGANQRDTAEFATAHPVADTRPIATAAPIASPIENATFLGSTAGQVIGGIAGAGLGAAGGAALATPLAVPTAGLGVPVGAVAGGIVGGVVGTYAGYYAGAYLGTLVAQQAPQIIPNVLP
ncbi:hypothetical protein [Nocardia canadensis]|uniref:hypothetical protein n=1 Tax=Nocardia canadensis TaxID=3065238 RepID=UPI00292F475F|nr:hypothetical protein [Nocardia canadensis]